MFFVYRNRTNSSYPNGQNQIETTLLLPRQKTEEAGVEKAAGKGTDQVGDQVGEVAAAPEKAVLEEFDGAAVEEGKDHGKQQDVAPAEAGVEVERQGEQHGGDEEHAEMHHLVEMGDADARVGDVVARQDAEGEDNERPNDISADEERTGEDAHGHGSKIRTLILMSFRGRSALSVGSAAILSMTSKPSMTSPNTVYSLSRWCTPPWLM